MDKLFAHAVFDISVNDGPRIYSPNLLPTVGRNAVLDILLFTTPKPSGWFLAPFAGNVTPQNTWTMTNFTTEASEFSNYSEANRPSLVLTAADNASINNHNARAEIVVGPNDGPMDRVIRGLAVTSGATKSGTTGILLSASLLPSPRTNLQEGDIITLGFSLSLSNAP